VRPRTSTFLPKPVQMRSTNIRKPFHVTENRFIRNRQPFHKTSHTDKRSKHINHGRSSHTKYALTFHFHAFLTLEFPPRSRAHLKIQFVRLNPITICSLSRELFYLQISTTLSFVFRKTRSTQSTRRCKRASA
jgi:hypothetical protein